MVKYKLTGKRGFFDEQETLATLSLIGNPLEKLSAVIDFEQFRPILEENLLNKETKNNAGASVS
jgi:hypothetical protein